MDGRHFYIDGRWLEPAEVRLLDLVDPADESVFSKVALGGPKDVDRAVSAARRALPAFAATPVAERAALLGRIADLLDARKESIARLMSREMGAPLQYAIDVQVVTGIAHLRVAIEVLVDYAFERRRGGTLIRREPIGVAGLITPWNFPINQIACKIAPAIAAGCTMVLKPSELAPHCALAFAQIMHDAGTPPGVFNLVNGDGTGVGHAIAAHPGIDMVSFTGSTRAGIQVAETAAPTVKRVRQELGGKSANVILPDVDLERAVTLGVGAAFRNSGQSCSAPTRMLVSRSRYADAADIAQTVAAALKVGHPLDPGTTHGPLSNRAQFEKVSTMIDRGLAAGAVPITGGPGRPPGCERGFYVRPTVFGGVTPDMEIAREEIFGPVLSLMAYDDEEDAIRIANDSSYGLAAYVQSGDIERARRLAARLEAGIVHINYPAWDPAAPFGGIKLSGNGREYGEAGLEEFLELKALVGYYALLKPADRLQMPVIDRIAELAHEAAEWRRDYHRHPELLYDVHRTAADVAAKLRSFGCDEVVEGIGRTGVVGVVRGSGGANRPVIGLRADMDALPIAEESGKPWASTVPGKMHACGHDGHTAMLLCAARYLAETRRFGGTAIVIFQPAEEGGAGGRAMVEDGLMDRFGIEEVYGLHNYPGLPVGRFAIRPGPMLAATDRFTLDIEGHGAHAARPHKGVDTILVGTAIVQALQSIVARNVDPISSAVVSVTTFHAGDTFNVLPQRARITGTARTLDAAVRDLVERKLGEMIRGIAASYGATADFRFERNYPVTVNHAEQTGKAAEAAAAVSGSQNVDTTFPPVMGGEDFSFMLEARPGAFIFMGNGDTPGLHHPAYDFNDAALPYGATYWAMLVQHLMPPQE